MSYGNGLLRLFCIFYFLLLLLVVVALIVYFVAKAIEIFKDLAKLIKSKIFSWWERFKYLQSHKVNTGVNT